MRKYEKKWAEMWATRLLNEILKHSLIVSIIVFFLACTSLFKVVKLISVKSNLDTAYEGFPISKTSQTSFATKHSSASEILTRVVIVRCSKPGVSK